MVPSLRTVYIAIAVISLACCLISNVRMVRYLVRSSRQLFWEQWRYYLLPGLVVPEYRRAAREHEPDGVGIWLFVYFSGLVSLIMAGLVLGRL